MTQQMLHFKKYGKIVCYGILVSIIVILISRDTINRSLAATQSGRGCGTSLQISHRNCIYSVQHIVRYPLHPEVDAKAFTGSSNFNVSVIMIGVKPIGQGIERLE